jgi:hypothetical protein
VKETKIAQADGKTETTREVTDKMTGKIEKSIEVATISKTTDGKA